MSLFVFMKYAEEEYQAIQLYRQNAFTLLGVAHFNYNSLIRGRQTFERIVLERKEKSMAEVKEIIEKVEELANDSVKLANFAEQIVKINPKLAESLEFILGVELQELARSKENANEI